MYVTRPLSRYLANPTAAAEAPPEGPGSGFLVVVDEAAVEQARTCYWGLCRDREVRSLPFPQSLQLSLKEDDTPHPAETAILCVSETFFGVSGSTGRPPVTAPDYAVFVPVVGEPLSSRRYYVVRARGKHTGKVSACSRLEDKTTCCCFCSITKDVPPRSFDRGDVYQQVEEQQLAPGRNGFRAVAVAGDGIPPNYLRKKKGWKVEGMASPVYDLADDAQGVDVALRARMPPDLDGAAGVLGRWYVPFLFVKADGDRRLKDQFRRCTFYKMTLEQSWEQIYSHEGTVLPGREPPEEVTVTATVRRFTVLLGGTDAVRPQADGGVMWFPPQAAGTTAAGVGVVGLDMVVWERMKWEVDRGGWVAAAGNGRHEGDELERIERVERRDGGGGLGQWRKFGCYLLVERFELRRTDGSVALTCEFRFTNKIRARWVLLMSKGSSFHILPRWVATTTAVFSSPVMTSLMICFDGFLPRFQELVTVLQLETNFSVSMCVFLYCLLSQSATFSACISYSISYMHRHKVVANPN
ncbi:hypothetical protein BS78_05G248400 [Paspalum vaginatum]|nr:hypothetical protein BS78_05G248400 [Paspalum vaginatum]